MDVNWRAQQRRAIEDVAAVAEQTLVAEHVSPSGRYVLAVSSVDTPKGWNYSVGLVRRRIDGSEISTVLRNYPQFPFHWVERHKNGHDYLICGEDYQGQTVIELDTGARQDYLGDDAKAGLGFCWTSYRSFSEPEVLVVEGCYWACPGELAVFDFSDPMAGSMAELHRWSGELGSVDWPKGEGTLQWTFYRGHWERDGRATDEMAATEYTELADSGDKRVVGTFKGSWEPGTPFASSDIVVVPESSG